MNFSSPITNPPLRPIITDGVFVWLKAVLVFPILALSFVGIATNIINILVFVQQGLLSSSNIICLFTLAFSDILTSVFRILLGLCEVIDYVASPVTVNNCKAVTFFYFSTSAQGIGRTNIWITVYIAIERCLCVLMPLKVKLLFTPRAAMVAMTIILLSVVSLYSTFYAFTSLSWSFDASINATMAVMVETEEAEHFFTFVLFAGYAVLSPTSVVITASATGVMVYKLEEHRKWRQLQMATTRQASTSGFNETKIEARKHRKDVDMMKMVLVATSIFSMCQTMVFVSGLAPAFASGLTFSGHNTNLFFVTFAIQTLFDAINSSLNFFFYKIISSQYKKAFREVFKRCKHF